MQGLMQFIMARFYKRQNCISESESNSSPTSSPVSSSSKKSSPGSASGSKQQKGPPQPDHEPQNCEACQVGRCPRPQKDIIPDKEHQIPGAQINNDKDMKMIAWALLDQVSWPSFVRAENNKRDISEEDKKKTLVLSPDIKSLSLYPSSWRTSKHQTKLGS